MLASPGRNILAENDELIGVGGAGVVHVLVNAREHAAHVHWDVHDTVGSGFDKPLVLEVQFLPVPTCGIEFGAAAGSGSV